VRVCVQVACRFKVATRMRFDGDDFWFKSNDRTHRAHFSTIYIYTSSSTFPSMAAVSGAWQNAPERTTPLDQLTKEVLSEQAAHKAGVNNGIFSDKRADFLMRLDEIKSQDLPLTEAQKPAYAKLVDGLDEKIRLLRSKESLETTPAPPQ
jgi:hypothetical protein